MGEGKDEAPQATRSSAVDAKIEEPQAPRGVGVGRGVPSSLGKGLERGAMLEYSQPH